MPKINASSHTFASPILLQYGLTGYPITKQYDSKANMGSARRKWLRDYGLKV
jgi:hypothetical protein